MLRFLVLEKFRVKVLVKVLVIVSVRILILVSGNIIIVRALRIVSIIVITGIVHHVIAATCRIYLFKLFKISLLSMWLMCP